VRYLRWLGARKRPERFERHAAHAELANYWGKGVVEAKDTRTRPPTDRRVTQS